MHRSQYPRTRRSAAGALLGAPSAIRWSWRDDYADARGRCRAGRAPLNQSQPSLIVVSIPDVYNNAAATGTASASSCRRGSRGWTPRRANKGALRAVRCRRAPRARLRPGDEARGRGRRAAGGATRVTGEGGKRPRKAVWWRRRPRVEPFALATPLHVGFSSSKPVGYDATATVWTLPYYLSARPTHQGLRLCSSGRRHARGAFVTFRRARRSAVSALYPSLLRHRRDPPAQVGPRAAPRWPPAELFLRRPSFFSLTRTPVHRLRAPAALALPRGGGGSGRASLRSALRAGRLLAGPPCSSVP